ncbi:MAG: peptidylprolyl isomerase [Defluviicoccus sp.]|nr:peptidylprolyl isomerase [Defluviicoccus sp.]MDG4610014.1 peptidylprolyl isomerase [Defluviicoccus sp.]
MLYMQLKGGRVVIQLRPDLAPKHVARIKELTRQKFYDGLVFHRVIDGFMAQGGDPKGTGTGGSGVNLPAEFSSAPFVRGTLGMARSANPNSADSQFFICFAPAPHLNKQYTVWGQVIEGMEFVDALKRGEPPSQPDRILTMRVAADVDKQ